VEPKVGMSDKAYLHHIYCTVKDWIQGEEQFIQSDQDVHVYGYGYDGYGKVDTSLGRTMIYQRGALQRVFKFFSNKIPKHSSI
jgi:hypothetical protein